MRMLPTKWSGGSITYERPVMMGILNVTPDSLSDGGAYAELNSAADHAFRLIDEGAGIIDIGAESTRPGWTPVSAREEINRLVPVIREIAPSCDVPISVDTMKTEVAEAAIEAGASMINDVYGLRWRGMPELAATTGVPVIMMHINGELENMHSEIMTGDVLPQIKHFFDERVRVALDAGVKENRIILDPGIGFGKTVQQNLELLNRLGEISALGYPVLLGPSRKSFIGYTLDLPPDQRLEGTAAAVCVGILRGADIIRVHDVEFMVRLARMTDAILGRKLRSGLE